MHHVLMNIQSVLMNIHIVFCSGHANHHGQVGEEAWLYEVPEVPHRLPDDHDRMLVSERINESASVTC